MAADEPRYPIGSVDHALRLLRLVDERGTVRVVDAAAHLGVVPSTAHRLLAMLCRHGFAVRDEHRRYHAAGRAPAEVAPAVRDALRALSREVDETVHLVVLDGTSVRFVEGVEGGTGLRVGRRTGFVLPAHTISGGKAMLAALSRAELDRLYPRGLPRSQGPAVSDLAQLRRDLAVIRRRGYAVNREESERGITGVGVRLDPGPAAGDGAALVIGVPTVRCGQGRIPVLARALRAAADRLAAGQR